MFIGEYRHSLDDKGRLAVPAKFRAVLKKGAVITKGLDNCLVIYTQDAWQKFVEKIASLPTSQASTRAFERHLLAGAMEFEIDTQGRALIPEYLRAYAKIKKDVVVTGLYSRLEVWDRSAWDMYKSANEKEAKEIAEKMTI